VDVSYAGTKEEKKRKERGETHGQSGGGWKAGCKKKFVVVCLCLYLPEREYLVRTFDPFPPSPPPLVVVVVLSLKKGERKKNLGPGYDPFFFISSFLLLLLPLFSPYKVRTHTRRRLLIYP